jgi:hypothetical protein
MTRSQETRLKKLEQVRSARPRRYCFHFDEVAEAEAQGLPYVLVPRTLSKQEWIERYSGDSYLLTNGQNFSFRPMLDRSRIRVLSRPL